MWCSVTCRNRETRRQVREAGRERDYMAEKIGQRGEVYQEIRDHPLLEDVLTGKITRTHFGEIVGHHHSTISKALAAIQQDRIHERQAEGWTPEPEVLRMLMLDEDGQPLLPPTLTGPAFEEFLEAAVEAFVQFRDTFFSVKVRGGGQKPYLTEIFHRHWIKETLRAIYTGSKLLILSPPRHGKSELLVHFCVWLIARDPNITIMWVGGNGVIASNMVTSVRDHLENNSALIAAVLPPGVTWAPTKRIGASWKSDEFKVANRTVVGLKAPTMVAVGRSGKILSRDCDFIITDDIEDHESVSQPAARVGTRTWVTTTLDSRKEEHTGWVCIGSRQHTDDVYSYLLEDDEWQSIVDSAHDPTCPLDPHDKDAHIDCMLFPAMRTYRWLYGKRRSAAAMGEEGLYEMVYLNRPRPEGASIFIAEEMEACANRSRPIGRPQLLTPDGMPMNLRLVAGLDPAATGTQAAFGWAWTPNSPKFYMVDMNLRVGGGIDAFLDIAQIWLDRYGIAHWVVEDMGFQKGYRTEKRVVDWANEHGVYIEGHTTGANKADPLFGVGSMSRLYREQLIDLPYGTAEAREKVNTLIRQALKFSDETGNRRRKTGDGLMASWFPTKVFRRWQREESAEMDVDYDATYAEFEMSDWNTAPW